MGIGTHGTHGAASLGSVCVVAAIALLLLLEGNANPTAGVALCVGIRPGRQPQFTSLLNALTAICSRGPGITNEGVDGYNITAFGLGGALGPWLGDIYSTRRATIRSRSGLRSSRRSRRPSGSSRSGGGAGK